jgi:hypothetical protein
MIEHLSAEQISQWMIGERTPQLQRHVAVCEECRAELEQLQTALSQFRTAMRAPASSILPPAWREPAPRSGWLSWPRMVLATAAVVVLVALPITWRTRERERAAEAALADSQLLERVDSAISQAVPEPMEPLVTLVTWNTSSAQSGPNAGEQRK